MLKRGAKLFLVLFAVLIVCLSLVSAGFFSNLMGKITGDAVDDKGPSQVTTPSCTDSDGSDYSNVGYVDATIQKPDGRLMMDRIKDICINNTHLQEQTCDGVNHIPISYACPFACDAGACVTPTCTDSDDGNETEVSGITIFTLGSLVIPNKDDCALISSYDADGKPAGWQDIYSCVGADCYVDEAFCRIGENGLPVDSDADELIKCEFGCENGACVGCVDSDGGLNDYSFGSVIGLENAQDTSADTHPDDCFEGKLQERFCNNGFVGTQEITCPYGCVDGSCQEPAMVQQTCVRSKSHYLFTINPKCSSLISAVADNSCKEEYGTTYSYKPGSCVNIGTSASLRITCTEQVKSSCDINPTCPTGTVPNSPAVLADCGITPETVEILGDAYIVNYGDDSYSEDYSTGLLWTKDLTVVRYGPTYTNGADDYCSDLSLKGYGEWRLPTQVELFAVLQSAPLKLNADLQTNGNRKYWTSDVTGVVIASDGVVDESYSPSNRAFTLCVTEAEEPLPTSIDSCQICKKEQGQFDRTTTTSFFGSSSTVTETVSYSNPLKCTGFNDTELTHDFNCNGATIGAFSTVKCYAGNKDSYSLSIGCGDSNLARGCQICSRYARDGRDNLPQMNGENGLVGYVYTNRGDGRVALYAAIKNNQRFYFKETVPAGYVMDKFIGYVYPTPAYQLSPGYAPTLTPIYNVTPSAVNSNTKPLAYVSLTTEPDTTPLYEVYDTVGTIKNIYFVTNKKERDTVLGWDCAQFSGDVSSVNFIGDFANPVDANDDLDVKVTCESPATELREGCQICRRQATSAAGRASTPWECQLFDGSVLETDLLGSIVLGKNAYALDYKVQCDVQAIQPETCTDTDNGDIYTSGSCTDASGNAIPDYCSGSNLVEYSCGSDLTCQTETIPCPYGCINNACLPKSQENDVYFVYTQKGSFDRTLNDLVPDSPLSNINFKNTRFKIVIDERMLSAITSTTGYTEDAIKYDSDPSSYSQIIGIGRNAYEDSSVPKEVFEGIKINADAFEDIMLVDLTALEQNNWSIFSTDLIWNKVHVVAGDTIKSRRAMFAPKSTGSSSTPLTGSVIRMTGMSWKPLDDFGDAVGNLFGNVGQGLVNLVDVLITQPAEFFITKPLNAVYCLIKTGEIMIASEDETCPTDTETKATLPPTEYINRFDVYVDFLGKLHFAYTTGNPNSRAVVAVAVAACECNLGDERCIDTVSETCEDGCSWTREGEVAGKCGFVAECDDSDGGTDYFRAGTATAVSGELSDTCRVSADDGTNTGALSEATCNEFGVPTYETYECPMGCDNGACISCTDSDGSDYYSIGNSRGITESGLIETQEDQCIGTLAIEKICSNGILTNSFQECGGGCDGEVVCEPRSCSVNNSGVVMCGMTNYNSTFDKTVCRTTTGDYVFGETLTSYDDGIIQISACATGCNETIGVCIAHECIDEDAGAVDEFFRKSSSGLFEEPDSIITDVCRENGVLSEAVCGADGKPVYSDHTCDFGCAYGKCTGEIICNDSVESGGDGGLDYFHNGTTVYCVGDACSEPEAESCSDTSTLWESYCGKDDELIWQKQYCSDGCSNGACVIPDEKPLAACFALDDEYQDHPINPGVRVSKVIEGVVVRQYCNPFTLELENTEGNDAACLNDFQCESNVCIEGVCTAIRGTLAEQKAILEEQVGLLIQIKCFLRDVFGVEDSVACEARENAERSGA